MSPFEAAGWLATIAVLVTYRHLAKTGTPAAERWFHWANACGFPPIAVVNALHGAWQSVALNLAFGYVAIKGLRRARLVAAPLEEQIEAFPISLTAINVALRDVREESGVDDVLVVGRLPVLHCAEDLMVESETWLPEDREALLRAGFRGRYRGAHIIGFTWYKHWPLPMNELYVFPATVEVLESLAAQAEGPEAVEVAYRAIVSARPRRVITDTTIEASWPPATAV